MIVNDALLTYALETEPSPLVVSPPTGAPSIGNVTIVASAPPHTTVTVTKISLSLPVGDPNAPGARDLTDDATALVCSAVFTDGTAWTVVSPNPGSFDITPPGGSVAISKGALTITIPDIIVNTIVGTAQIAVAESAASATAQNIPRTAGVDVAKFPYGFFIDDFTSDVGEVANGGTATFTWVGSSGATYTIIAGSAQPVDVSNQSTWTSPPLIDTTTFVLDVAAQEYGQTVSARFPFTVTVSNPTYPSETVDGALSAGSLTVGSTTALNGATTVNATLDVTGVTTLAAASTAALTATSVTAGSVTTTAAFSATAATVSTLGAFSVLTVDINDGSYFTSTTDGLVVATISGAQAGAALYGAAQVDSSGNNGFTFIASGAGNGGSFTMPVAAGTRFQLSGSGPFQPGSATFTFVPFGAGTVRPD